MLSLFRRASSSWLVLALLGFVAIAVVVTGVDTGFGGGASTAAPGDTLAEVGDETITSTEVSDQVNRQLERLRQQDPELEIGRFINEGGFETIVDQLINTRAMLVFGREQGVGVSRRMVDAEIAGIPAFQNLAGQFDQQAFQRALQNERVSEKQLRDDLASTLIQRQIMVPVAGIASCAGHDGAALRIAAAGTAAGQRRPGQFRGGGRRLSADRRGGECVLHEQPQPLHDPGTAGDPLRLVR
jgi:peptidyl-prolyl cis-trans isomerase D